MKLTAYLRLKPRLEVSGAVSPFTIAEVVGEQCLEIGPKRDGVTRVWRKLHNEELYNLYFSPKIRMIRSRRMRWAGYVTRMGRTGIHTGLWWLSQKEICH
jgi:hypothetical protein